MSSVPLLLQCKGLADIVAGLTAIASRPMTTS